MKKMNLWKLLFGAMLVFAATAFTSCVDDNEDNGMPFLDVTPETLSFSLDGVAEGVATFEVKTNRPWTLVQQEGSEWITVEPKDGRGNATVEVSVPATNEGRIGTLEFQLKNSYGAYMTKTVNVEQGTVVTPELVFKETFGPGVQGENVPVADYHEWDKSGSGASTTSYTAENAQLRTSSSSSSNGGSGSGGANLYFSGTPNYFIVNDITLPADQLSYTLTFGMYIYGPTSVDQYTAIYSAELSADGTTWTKVPFTITGFETSKYWNWGTVAFKLKNYTSKLYLRFSATTSNNRIEDIQLMTGNGGMVVDLENGSVEVDVAVTTNKPMAVSGTGATFSGALNTTSGVTAVGFQYAEFSDNIDWSNATKVAADAVAMTFTKAVTGLTEGKTYAVRAYATSEKGDVYGDVQTFKAEEVVVETTVKGLMAYVKGLDVAVSANAPLSDYVGKSIVGYIAANNEGGNLNKMIVVVDNTGEASSGLLLFGDKYNTVADYPVGAKVTFTVTAESKVSNYYGVLEIMDVETVVDKGTTATMVVPEITAEQLNSQEWCYMYVKVKDLTYKGTVGDTWYSGTASGASRTFANGDQSFVVRTSKNATYKDAKITTAGPAALFGVPQQNYYNNVTSVQLFPTDAADVAGFSAGALEPGVTTGAATSINNSGATLAGTSQNIDNATEVGVKYAAFAASIDWTTIQTKVAAATISDSWMVDVTGLTADTKYAYAAYAVTPSGTIYGETASFTTETAESADVTVNFADLTFPDGFPDSKNPGTTEKTWQFGNESYTIVPSSGEKYYYNSSLKTLFFGKKDAYILLPAVANKSLVRVSCTTVADQYVSKKVSVGVFNPDGATAVAGGETQLWDQADGNLKYTYNLTGTAVNTSYRLQITNAYNAQIAKLELWYTDGGSAAQPSLTPATASMEFAAEADATGKTQVYTVANADGLSLFATVADATNFKAEATDKTVKVTTLTANESAEARTTTVTVFLAENATAEKKATATINVTQAGKAAATPKTVAEFVTYIKSLNVANKATASLSEWAGQTVEGYIAANNSGNNLYKLLAVVDNTGNPGSGIILSDNQYTDLTAYPVGAKISIPITATSEVYNGGYFKINKVEPVVDKNTTVTITPAEITVAQFNTNDYQGMLVKIGGLHYTGSETTWITTNDNYQYRLFNDGTTELSVANYKTVTWKDEMISKTKTNGYLIGVGEYYDNKAQLYPQTPADVADFKSTTPTITGVTPSSLSWNFDQTDSKDVTVSIAGTSAALSLHGDIAPFTAVTNGDRITVTPPQAANETDADIVKTMTVSIAGGNSMNVTLTQKKKPAAGQVATFWKDDFSQFDTLNEDGTSDIASSLTGSVDDYKDKYSSGAKVYAGANGTLKFGSSSAIGTLTTPAMKNVPGASASAELNLDLKTFGSDKTQVVITVNGGGTIQGAESVTTDQLTADMQTLTYTLEGITPETTVTVAARIKSKNRFYLDNLTIVERK